MPFLAPIQKNNINIKIKQRNQTMLIEKISFRLFALSNLLAAFGGGMILGKGMGIIDTPYLQEGSLLAFFIGTVVGLVFLQAIPTRYSKPTGRFFSILGGLTSLSLFFLYTHFAINEKLYGTIAIVFFALLTLRFGFWFFSRVMRASAAAGHQQKIAWVELGYYSGIILGLIVWKFFNINIGISVALLVDAFLQFSAGILDYLGSLKKTSNTLGAKIKQNVSIKPYDSTWGWKSLLTVVFLTIAVQVVIFNFAHHVSEALGAYILAVFYFGVSVAAYVCHQYNIYLTWNNETISSVCSEQLNGGNKTKISAFIIALAILISPAICIVNNYSLSFNISVFFSLITYVFVFIAAFIYEVLALVILDKMGHEEKISNRSGMVMRTYGLMGVGAVISMWMLGIANSFLLSSLSMLAIPLLGAFLLIGKRNFSALGALRSGNDEAINENT